MHRLTVPTLALALFACSKDPQPSKTSTTSADDPGYAKTSSYTVLEGTDASVTAVGLSGGEPGAAPGGGGGPSNAPGDPASVPGPPRTRGAAGDDYLGPPVDARRPSAAARATPLADQGSSRPLPASNRDDTSTGAAVRGNGQSPNDSDIGAQSTGKGSSQSGGSQSGGSLGTGGAKGSTTPTGAQPSSGSQGGGGQGGGGQGGGGGGP